MSENVHVKESQRKTSSENVEGEFPEIQSLTQEAVNEQHKGFITPLTDQPEESTRLIKGMVTTPHPSQNPRTVHVIFSGTATHQLDNQKLINVHDLRCRIDASLMLLLTTILGHHCYRCVLDWGVKHKPFVKDT